MRRAETDVDLSRLSQFEPYSLFAHAPNTQAQIQARAALIGELKRDLEDKERELALAEEVKAAVEQELGHQSKKLEKKAKEVDRLRKRLKTGPSPC